MPFHSLSKIEIVYYPELTILGHNKNCNYVNIINNPNYCMLSFPENKHKNNEA